MQRNEKFIITDTRRNNHMKKIGFIGVGIMGKSMVRNLMKAGFELHIYARTRSKVEDVITIVGFPVDVEEVYFDKGNSAQCGEIVAVCVDGSNASRSAFSGMTEAFYRQLPVILITLGNSLDYTMELKDVVLGHYLVKDAKEILNFANYKLPAHIELGEEIIIDTEVESLKLQEALMEAVSEKDYLYFSPRFQTKEKDFMCKCISGGMSRCKDGTLSNVFGASLAQKRRRYIGVVTEEEFLHDMNTLGNIHANKNLFFIVISQKFEKMIGDYARTLNYEVICEAEDNICGTSLKRLFENGKQTIFIMLKK